MKSKNKEVLLAATIFVCERRPHRPKGPNLYVAQRISRPQNGGPTIMVSMGDLLIDPFHTGTPCTEEQSTTLFNTFMGGGYGNTAFFREDFWCSKCEQPSEYSMYNAGIEQMQLSQELFPELQQIFSNVYTNGLIPRTISREISEEPESYWCKTGDTAIIPWDPGIQMDRSTALTALALSYRGRHVPAIYDPDNVQDLYINVVAATKMVFPIMVHTAFNESKIKDILAYLQSVEEVYRRERNDV